MRAIAAAIDAKPDRAFTVDDLCCEAFPDAQLIEKKHRVAVTRAMWAVVQSRSDLKIDRLWRRGSPGRGTLVLYHAANADALITRRQEEHPERFPEYSGLRFNPKCFL